MDLSISGREARFLCASAVAEATDEIPFMRARRPIEASSEAEQPANPAPETIASVFSGAAGSNGINYGAP